MVLVPDEWKLVGSPVVAGSSILRHLWGLSLFLVPADAVVLLCPDQRRVPLVIDLHPVVTEEKKRGRTRKRKPLTEEDRAKVKKIQEITEYYFTSEGLGKNTRLRQRVVGNVDGFGKLPEAQVTVPRFRWSGLIRCKAHLCSGYLL